MTTPTNLNHARKAKVKAERTQKADENRIKFGRTKAEKSSAKAAAAQHKRSVDAHKRER